MRRIDNMCMRLPNQEGNAVRREIASSVALLITIVAMVASAGIFLTLPETYDVLRHDFLDVAAFLGLTLVLQVSSVEVYGRGSLSVAAIGILAAGFSLGVGPAMAIAFSAAIVQWIRRRGLFHRAIFDAANFSLSAGVGALVFDVASGSGAGVLHELAAATAAGVAYTVVNIGLLCAAMGLSEGTSSIGVWRERFRWTTPHYLGFGPVALASAIAFESVGLLGLLAFAVPPALMTFSIRQYLNRTRAAVEEVRSTNDELQRSNRELEARNDDLRELFDLAGGLAARAHDRSELTAYTEAALARLTGARARFVFGQSDNGIALVSGGSPVGSLHFSDREGFDEQRWLRLRDVLLPQLATAFESSLLVEQVRKTHRDTIAALSRSMEAKDYYTGGHTERVSGIAVELGRRLGYSGTDLEAIEIGALLHDIGKIGIPERIIQKPGPLDDEEWRQMREHPLISDFILSEIDLPPVVREIARWSHERIDGKGYPDGLVGDEIPLPARIIHVADAFDAITTDRSYRPARPVAAALREIRACAGTQFCPVVTAALDRLAREQPELLGSGPIGVVDAGVGVASG